MFNRPGPNTKFLTVPRRDRSHRSHSSRTAGHRDPACAREVIPIGAGVRIWIATGHCDMRRGMPGLALQVQEGLKRNPNAGDLYIFRGRRGDLIKILWHDGVGMSLYAKRLERGKFIWPSASDGVVSISPAQMGYMLEAIDWRNPQHTFRPELAG
jgi:transposase